MPRKPHPIDTALDAQFTRSVAGQPAPDVLAHEADARAEAAAVVAANAARSNPRFRK
jgi:hypothetical protein